VARTTALINNVAVSEDTRFKAYRWRSVAYLHRGQPVASRDDLLVVKALRDRHASPVDSDDDDDDSDIELVEQIEYVESLMPCAAAAAAK